MPVAGQPVRMWRSSSWGSLQQGQAEEVTMPRRWSLSRGARAPVRMRAIHLITGGGAECWKELPGTVGRRKMRQEMGQEMADAEG